MRKHEDLCGKIQKSDSKYHITQDEEGTQVGLQNN